MFDLMTKNATDLKTRRDIVKDLFENAKARHPELHRGVCVDQTYSILYFSDTIAGVFQPP